VQTAGQARNPAWGVAAAETEEAAAAKATAGGAAAAAGGAAGAAAAAAATTTRAEAVRASEQQCHRLTALTPTKRKATGTPLVTGPWRSIKTRRPPRSSLWTGSQTCERSGGSLVEEATQRALLFLISSEVILCLDLALACS